MLKEQENKKSIEVGRNGYADQDMLTGYDDLDDEDAGVGEPVLLLRRQQRRRERYQQRIQLLKREELKDKAQSEQHKNITIRESPCVSDRGAPVIDVQQVSDTPDVPTAGADQSEFEPSAEVTGAANFHLGKDTSVDRNNSIISEVDPAFEEQTPNHRDRSREALPL